MAVLVMAGEHSTVAVPMAREIIKAYYDKRPKPVQESAQTQARLMKRQ